MTQSDTSNVPDVSSDWSMVVNDLRRRLGTSLIWASSVASENADLTVSNMALEESNAFLMDRVAQLENIQAEKQEEEEEGSIEILESRGMMALLNEP